MLKCIRQDKIYGECDGIVAVIEFQQRGAPHCHMLFWIKGFVPTPKNIDDMICAKIPSPDDPLHDLVCSKMIHGPCGPEYNMDYACCKDNSDGSCDKGFPKQFNPLTRIGEDSFPDYRRRSPDEGGHIGKV